MKWVIAFCISNILFYLYLKRANKKVVHENKKPLHDFNFKAAQASRYNMSEDDYGHYSG